MRPAVDCVPGAEAKRARFIIVGTGFAGLAMAIRLKQRGEHDFMMLERADDIGGVWRDNHYPGCACDVQSHLYSFSFAPNPHWSRQFSPQPEIHAYLKQCAGRFGLWPHIRLAHEVSHMAWQEARGEWAIQTNQGEYRARFVLGAFGWLSDPAIPRLRGIEDFRGQVFHSATWPRDFDPTGKRVAVIGTGASAIQFVPAIQPLVARLHVYQRTPPWVIPRTDGPVSPFSQTIFELLPPLQRLARLRIYLEREVFVVGFRHPRLMKSVQRLALKHLHAAIKDPALRAKLTPDYVLGCKRILISNDYYPALAQPNVDVITAGIARVTARGIIDAGGSEREVDTIIFGTGFQIKDPPFAYYICGSEGQTLADVWRGSPKAYLGTTVAGFPNLFLVPGPNTGLGHTSVIYMTEAQIEHISQILAYMDRQGFDIIEPSAAAQARFAAEMDRRMLDTVWTAGGCQSWYLDRNGRNSSLWPGFTFEFGRRLAQLAPRDYEGRRAARLPSADPDHQELAFVRK